MPLVEKERINNLEAIMQRMQLELQILKKEETKEKPQINKMRRRAI